jgi:PAS domain S-box-containing protein
MSNKRMRKRLDKLFTDIKEQETAQVEPKPKRTPRATAHKDSAQVVAPVIETPPPPKPQPTPQQIRSAARGVTRMLVEPTETIKNLPETQPGQTPLSLVFRTGDQNWNTLEVVDEAPERNWTADEQLLVKQVVDQLTLAIQNAQLFQQTQRQNEDLAVLNDMARDLSASLDINGVARTIYTYTGKLMDVSNFYIALYKPETDEINFPFITLDGKQREPYTTPLGKGLTSLVLNTRQPLYLPENVMESLPELGVEFVPLGDENPTLCWLGVPMVLGQNVLGVISVQSDTTPRLYTERHRDLLVAIAGQGAIAIQNAQLFQQTQRQNADLAVLNELGRELTTQLDVNQIIETIYKFTSRLMDTENFFVALYQGENEEVTLPLLIDNGKRLNLPSRKLGNGLTDYVLRTHKYLLLDGDIPTKVKERGLDLVIVGDETPPVSWLGVPLALGKEILGAIVVQSTTVSNLYTDRDRDLLTAIASQASIAVQNARLFENTQKRNEELAALNEIIGAASQTLELGSMLDTVLEKVLETIGFSAGIISLINPTTQRLELQASKFMPPPVLDKLTTQGLDGTLCAYVAETKKLVALGDLKENSPIDVSGLLANGLASYLGVPLESKGRIMGTLCTFNNKPTQMSETLLTLVQSMAGQLGIAIENASLFENTQYRALVEKLVSDISSGFVNVSPEEVDRQITASLQKLGEFTHVDRAYLYQISDDGTTMDNTHEWCADGISSNISDLQNIPTDTYPYLLKHIRKLDNFYAAHITDLPKTAAAEKAKFMKDGTQSIICLPISTRGVARGFIGFDSVRQEKVWPEAEVLLLKLAGEIFAGSLQRKDAEEEISKFKMGIERSGDAVFMTDIDGRILYINPAFTAVYGYTQDEALGKTPRILKSGVLNQEYYKRLWDTMLAKGTFSDELVNKAKDGRLIPIAGTNSPILDENNNILGFLAVQHDITDTKQAEEALRRSEEALRRQNEYLATAADVGRLITSTLDLNTLFSRTVELIRTRFGYYHVAIFTLDESGFNTVLREGTGEAGSEMKKRNYALAVGSRSVIGQVTSTGRTLLVNNTAIDSMHRPNPLLPETRAEAGIPLRIGDRVVGALNIQSADVEAFKPEDIAVLEILADQIAVAIDNARSYDISQKAVAEMRELDRFKTQFLANMSHELRTPLNSIIGFSRVILKGIDGPITDQQNQDLTAIYNSGQHLLGLINDILDLSKIDAGKMELAFDEVNIVDTIHGVISTAVGLVKDKPIKLVQDVNKELPTVRADPMRIRQVLLNLLSNASKFTDEGSITVSATKHVTSTGAEEVMISVTDTGPGIAAEDQAKLFQPFSQVDASPTRKTGGTGLGLSICQQLVKLHGGRIGVHSTVGKGSAFYFTLPVFENKELTPKVPEGAKAVLCIDDDKQVISLYERYLKPQGYYVVPLTDPTKATEVARDLKPYAITLDIMMPGCDGWQVIHDLKTDSDTHDLPVIICSIIEEEEKGFSLGAADYLVKPILEDELVNALNRLNGDGSIHEVLIIDDDANDLRLIEKIISERSHYKAIAAQGGSAGWNVLTENPPQAVILDLFMPDLDGFTILERLRANPRLRDIPVIVVSGIDLNQEQKKKLDDMGKRMLQKSMLNEKELFTTLERALKRLEVTGVKQ